MHWILQNNIFKESAFDELLAVLERFNISHSIHKVVPFIGELEPAPSIDHDNVICMGSYSMRHYAKKMGWNPGVFDLEPFDFTVQMQHWGQYMLNADAVVSRFEDVNFTEEQMFIRPIHDSKVFAGNVFTKDEFYEWKRKVCVLEHDYGDSLTKNTLVQVCKPKKIYAEYRFWIVAQRIVTASLYKRGTQVIYSLQVDAAVYSFANQILKTKNNSTSITLSMANDGWQPHDAFCLDIAETPDGFKVVEINTLNSCGFYAANMTDLVLSLEGAFNKRT